jgi:hypothetical protein
VERDNIRLNPGEFSVASANARSATVPAVLNVQQAEAMKKNTNFEASSKANTNSNTQASSDSKPKKSMVPPGLTGKAVASESNSLKKSAVAASGEARPSRAVAAGPVGKAEGYVTSDGKVKPANGSFLHIETGVVVAPPEDAVFDANTNSYIASDASGTVSESGDYVPPQNIEIKESGEIVKIEVAADGQKVEQVISSGDNVVPVETIESASNSTTETVASNDTTTTQPTNDVLNADYNPNGLQDISVENNTQSGYEPSIIEATRARVGFSFNIQ